MSRRRAPVVALLGLFAAACSQGGPAASRPQPPSPPGPPAIVYVAIGASETAGVGTDDPRTQAWPTVLFQHYLPPTTTYYNLGIVGEKTGGALTDELPRALKLHPTLATIWLNVNDIVAGVSPSDYQTELRQLVHALRQGGTRVLLANTPQLDQLPLYQSCRSGLSTACGAAGSLAPGDLDAVISDYNAVAVDVAEAEGATLVDLNAAGEIPIQHPSWVSGDGFHPSTEGQAQIAARFAAAYSTAP